MYLDFPPVKECKHPEWTYGVICVKCGDCGRFDKQFTCTNCGYIEGKKPLSAYKDWGSVEFFDVFNAPICPNCRQYFPTEDRKNYPEDIEKYGVSVNHQIIRQHIKDFKQRGRE